MGANKSTPNSVNKQSKTERIDLPTPVHGLTDPHSTYNSNSASAEDHVYVGLCKAPEIKQLGDKAFIPEQTFAGYMGRDDKITIPQQKVAGYMERNSRTTISRQSIAGYVKSDNTTDISQQTVASFVESYDKTTTPQQTSAACVGKGDTTTNPFLNITEYVEKDVTSNYSSQGDAGYMVVNAENTIPRQTITKFVDCDNTATSLQQSATEAESIISKTVVAKKEVIDKSKSDEANSGQQQSEGDRLKLDVAIFKNIDCLSKSSVAENHVSTAENKVIETERRIEDRDIKTRSKAEIYVSKTENKYMNCYSELQLFSQETENSVCCAKNEGNASKYEEPSTQISERVTQYPKKDPENQLKDNNENKILAKAYATEIRSTEEEVGINNAELPQDKVEVRMNDEDKDVCLQNLDKITQYPKKDPENQLKDNENNILAKADATEITSTEEEVGINNAEGPHDNVRVKINDEVQDMLKGDQGTDNRVECELLRGENVDLDSAFIRDFQDHISVNASERAAVGDNFDGESMIVNNSEYCHKTSVKRESDIDPCYKAKCLASRLSRDESLAYQRLCWDEKPQNQSVNRDERSQNPSVCKAERIQNQGDFLNERPQSQRVCMDERPQNQRVCRDERPHNQWVCRDERLQNQRVCSDERPQNQREFWNERPQNQRVCSDERQQNQREFWNERPQNQRVCSDERPQNQRKFWNERPQNQRVCSDERPQNQREFWNERPQNRRVCSDERPQNQREFWNERPQNRRVCSDERPQNQREFWNERPQNRRVCSDERPQNQREFWNERPQNQRVCSDERPQNQMTSGQKFQNQSVLPKERSQGLCVPTGERLQGSYVLSRDRPQNSSRSAGQRVQTSLMSSERCHILSMVDNDRSRNENVPFKGIEGRTKKENYRSSHAKGKTTEVYVKFAETIEENIKIFGYIKNHLPPGIKFAVINRIIEQDTKNTIVTLQCKSKRTAVHLKAELAKGNYHSQTKICCFDTLQEARGLLMKKQQDFEKSFEQHMQQITLKSESALADHYTKLSDVESRLEKLQSVKSKFISIEQFNSQNIEERALEDKAKELNLQKVEFLKHVEYAICELTKAKESLNFEKIAAETRLNLAIECNRLSNAFPIYARRSDILEIVKNNQVSVIIGETGSGKSTQLAQYFLQGGLANSGMIACTQPRKIAATSLAVHVAKELGTAVGQVVGYKVGMQTKKTNLTRIIYLTDHILLNECLQDRKLSAFSCIIIDEAHERSIYTDLLLGMIKECLQDRPDLHLVITSATINPGVFVKYFIECPVLSVSGRMFPVEVEWKEPVAGAESFGNYQEEAVEKAIEVHQEEDKGDILVFLTSPLETEKCCVRFQDLMKGHPVDYVTLQLHGRLQGDEQQKVFDPVPGGKRKIVFATNCAETSVTIPGIKYVIDTGLGKEMKFDPIRKMSTLAVSMVTQSSAKQRQGRAGRLGPGKCFRLYTEDDFKKMNVDSLPEILKVHIGHAMLKLMELGVDPLKFDYIMSPSIPAMEEAFASLVHIGAVSEKKITDLGKWIAKMPFDPKYGAFVYEAVQVGAGLEAIIIAAASGTSSLFYRAGSNEEKDKADRHKIRFCHEGGDQLTLLSVFREWHKVPEKDKGKWCFSYCINGKSIKSVRETTNEVLHTLKKEMKVDLKFSFGRPEKLDNLLVGLLFKALNRNLSHYLGHAKAGYSIVSTEQRVEVHPSSALVSLGSQSEWIVFDQVMRTSRDFAMQTTPISEALVLKGIEEGWLQLQIEEAKKKLITVACQEYVGPQMFREFVGPRYVNMRNLETTLSEKFPKSFVVVEADWDKGELKVLSNEKNKECLADSLSQVLAPHRANFQLEESEERIGSITMDVCVRTVIGAGGNIVNVFMPEEFKIVKIFCSLETIDDISKEDILINFGQYGEIKELKKYYRKQKTSTVWGQITYEKTESAVKAVNGTKDKPELCARPNVRLPAHGIGGLRTKIQWCRRRSRRFGFVEFANVEDFMEACRLHSLYVGGSAAKVNVAKNSPQSVHVTNFNHLVTEDVLRQAFAEALRIDPDKSIVKVIVIREKVDLDKERFSIAKSTLLRKIEQYAQPGAFQLELREPRSEKDVNFVAFCMFNNLDAGYTACSEMNNEFYICNERVSVKIDIRSSLFIRKDVFKLSGEAVMEEIQHIENESKEVKIKLKHLKSENVSVDFHSDSVNALTQARERIQVIVRGYIINCEDNKAVRLLFTREGRKMLQTIMNDTKALIVIDDRVMAVSIHGSLRSKMNAMARVGEYLQQLSQGTTKNIDLKGTGKPPGVMKALMLKYGTDLSSMQTEAKLTTVNLDLRNHRVSVMGSDEAINKAIDLVDQVMKSLTANGVITSNDDDPDCVTCFCPIESKDLFRLECCGHAYCKECIKLQVDTAITSKDFPIVCGNEGCLLKFVWRDFVNLSRQGHITLAKLVSASLNAYVAQHKNDFHYCNTPDCPIVYRIREGGVPFLCPECNTKMCTSCHANYHDGLTCIMYKKMNEDDGSLGVWMKKDGNNRKICPNCNTPIEKVTGCNRMHCLGCKKYLCWNCLAIFDTEAECYGHLSSQHGGFM